LSNHLSGPKNNFFFSFSGNKKNVSLKDQKNHEKVVIRLRRPMGQRAEERSQLKVEDYSKHLEVVPSAGIFQGQP